MPPADEYGCCPLLRRLFLAVVLFCTSYKRQLMVQTQDDGQLEDHSKITICRRYKSGAVQPTDCCCPRDWYCQLISIAVRTVVLFYTAY